jgi:hypothetical protein
VLSTLVLLRLLLATLRKDGEFGREKSLNFKGGQPDWGRVCLIGIFTVSPSGPFLGLRWRAPMRNGEDSIVSKDGGFVGVRWRGRW